jgi:hypothetical protein
VRRPRRAGISSPRSQLAEQVHGHQRRKGTQIPNLARLLVVTEPVIEDGGAGP